MPVDAEPTLDGNLELGVANAPTLGVVYLSLEQRDRPATRPRYTSHFATCPNAKKHRKAR